MHALNYGLADPQASIHTLPRLLFEKDDDSGFIQEQPSQKVIAHSPEFGEFFN
jgi:hypothetical protein